eukprot:CAMPEP_0175071958 /NCGR_PEP_ID=MMETSP0052_2-20121109/19588_1 /TAXON_ID=51329 ORGANISM="Polytomella parva, Strain SAG 63-3" /NCGR_SAMPLE_ID=MMETSP0052_2 /ASSEMBLY_ACC=CAM_ASM_000194 /LENGTH=722 /DNA_ID=CAMNT_0016339299 /DNA_START=179 /DNA_END=2347 /DNA_ORIENTATION=+
MPSRRCSKGYDRLRLNLEDPGCYFLSTHDDFSVIQLLPPGTSVLSQLRDPVSRFVSAYEFAIEVAARFMSRNSRPYRKEPSRVITEDVWPWSYLVPFFISDMKRRKEERKLLNETLDPNVWIARSDLKTNQRVYYNAARDISKNEIPADDLSSARILDPIDPYDNPLVISFAEFVRHPIAAELLHNGQTYQVLGITNYSHFGEADAIRACMSSDVDIRDALHWKAKRRVKTFTHVGTTDHLFDSVASGGASLHLPLWDHAYAGGEDVPTQRHQDHSFFESSSSSVSSSLSSTLPSSAAGLSPNDTREEETASRSHGVLNGSDDNKAIEQMSKLLNQVNKARLTLRVAQRDLFHSLQANPSGDDSQSATTAALRDRLSHARKDLNRLQTELNRVRTLAPRASSLARQESLELHGIQLDSILTRAAAVGSDDPGSNSQGPRRLLGLRTPNPRLPTALGVHFKQCASTSQLTSNRRRMQSLSGFTLPDGRMIEFSKAARKGIPADLFKEIRMRNSLDLDLYNLGLQQLRKRVVLQRRVDAFKHYPFAPMWPNIDDKGREGGETKGRRMAAGEEKEGALSPAVDKAQMANGGSVVNDTNVSNRTTMMTNKEKNISNSTQMMSNANRNGQNSDTVTPFSAAAAPRSETDPLNPISPATSVDPETGSGSQGAVMDLRSATIQWSWAEAMTAEEVEEEKREEERERELAEAAITKALRSFNTSQQEGEL